MNIVTRNYIDISDFKFVELKKILNYAKKIKRNPKKFSNILKNKNLGLYFEQQSLRTRTSFEVGMKNLGGNVISIDKNEIGFGKRESEKDIINTLSQYIDCLIIRNHNHNKIKFYSELGLIPIINGLSNFSHPCQILSDIFTIEECLGVIKNKNICWIGNINNVLISLLQSASIFEFNLNIAVPRSILSKNKILVNKYQSKKINFYHDPSYSIQNSDCIMTDKWISMDQRKPINKKKLFKTFQVNDKLIKKAKKGAIFMHCLPSNRNEEVTDSVIDGKNSVIWQQVKNRMFVQQSLLIYCMK